MKLTAWLKERESHCRRIAFYKFGEDRDGWLEDADYFQSALDAVEELDRLQKLQDRQTNEAT